MDEIPHKPRTFTLLANGINIKVKDAAMLYKQRGQVELFFRWIKQHLRITSFWGNTKNAVRIQIYVAVVTYCLIAIITHDYQLGRTTFSVLCIVNRVLTDKISVKDLFLTSETIDDVCKKTVQLEFAFKDYC